MQIWEWIKTHKLSSMLILIISLFILPYIFSGVSKYPASTQELTLPSFNDSYSGAPRSGPSYNYEYRQSSPVAKGGINRMVTQTSQLSLLVTNVRETIEDITAKAVNMGGFMIQSDFSNPGESPSATVTIRIPSEKLKEYLKILKDQSIRVVSENLQSDDITDQYTDTQAKLDTLNSTKTKFELIYAKAEEIQDILDVQNKILQIQDQIDSIKGQINYMEKSVQMAKLTVYLSTDELALPYSDNSSWRPAIEFKKAIRSLIGNLHSLANFGIWIMVYAVIWAPAIIIFYWYRKRRQNKKQI